MRPKLLTLALAAIVCVGDVCAARADDLVGPVTGYALAQWTVNDGVPLGAVYAIVQDADGYLWLGTAAGAVRFDGARFTPWQTLYPDPVPVGPVHALRYSSGTLWAGFDGEGKTISVRALRDGRALVTDAGKPPRGNVTCIFPDRNGTVWAVSSGTLYRLRNGRWDELTQAPLPRGEVVSVGQRSKGELWIGTRGGLFKWDDGRDTFTQIEPGVVREFTEGPEGTVWVTAAGRAARRLDKKEPPSVLEGLGNRLLYDRRGNVWVATTGVGLWRIRDAARLDPVVEHATAQTGLSSDVVETLFEDREGNIWVGTTQGLHSLTPHVVTPLRAGAYVRAVLADAEGTVWVGTANGLVRFRHRADTWAYERAGPTGIDIHRLSRDTSGRLRIELDDQRTITGPAIGPLADGSDDSAPPPKRIYDGHAVVLERRDAHRTRFSALEGGALLIDHADGSHALVSPHGSAATAAIDAIYEDSRGTVWIGGTGGLCRVSGNELVCAKSADGLSEWRVLAMMESAEGDLWSIVDRGVAFSGRRAALIRVRGTDPFVTGQSQRVAYTVYDAGQGLAGAALGPSIVRASDGTLWVVTGGNLTLIDPRSLPTNSSVSLPRVLIEGASVDGEHVAFGTPSFPAGTRRVVIDYTALRLTAPRQLRFHYQLDGIDPEWVEAGIRRQAYYTNLAPGEYTFRVQASGEGNNWTEPAVTWTFTVRPMFYQTAWFYSTVVLGLTIAGWGAWRTRLWFLRRQFNATIAERTRLSREIHDTMLQSLAGIALQCQAIASRRGLAATTEQELLALRREVEQHIREARQAVWDLRSPLLEKRGLAGALDEVGRRLVNGRAIALEIATPGFHADQVSSDVESELLRIGQEAISNAIRHGSATRIRVDLRHESGRVRLRVSDNGCGFDVQSALSNVAGHYGVVGMRERAARLGGALELTSSPQRGTLVDVHVPAEATPLAS
jgi:ligand-binding sensor domain-containing protein